MRVDRRNTVVDLKPEGRIHTPSIGPRMRCSKRATSVQMSGRTARSRVRGLYRQGNDGRSRHGADLGG